MYYTKNVTADVNTIKYKLSVKKGSQSSRLPPARNCAILHMYRSNHQCYIWNYAQQPILNLLSPIGNGWIKPDGRKHEPELMKNLPASENLIELTVCGRTKSNMCKCRKANLTCIAVENYAQISLKKIQILKVPKNNTVIASSS